MALGALATPSKGPQRATPGPTAAAVALVAWADPPHPLLQTGPGPTVGNCIDGLDMPKQPGLMLNDSRSSSVPFLAGFNTDEATVFVYPNFPLKMNDTQFSTFVHESMNKDPQYDPAHAVSKSIIDQILTKYPLKPSMDNRIVASNLLSESSFQCGTVIPAVTYATRAKMYLYRFNHRTSFTRSDPTPGVFHSLDLPYVFGTPGSYKAKFTEEHGMAFSGIITRHMIPYVSI